MLVNKDQGDPNLVHRCRPGYREPMVSKGRRFVRHREAYWVLDIGIGVTDVDLSQG